MAEITERIGGRIRQLREERKATDPRWTQDHLARQLPGNRTGTEVSRWERGEVKPRDETLEQIAEVLDVDVAELYAGPVGEEAEEPADSGGTTAPDPFSAPPSSADLGEQVGRLESELAELRGEFSEMRSDLQLVLSLLQRDERDQGEPGGT